MMTLLDKLDAEEMKETDDEKPGELDLSLESNNEENRIESVPDISDAGENLKEEDTFLKIPQEPSENSDVSQEAANADLPKSSEDKELSKDTATSSETPDQKLQELIDKMESALSQGGTPNFKHFWDLRKVCLELFKENISPALRTQFWTRYRELSKEAKKLKDLFDEQSAFAVEQIEIAIKALEGEIEDMPHHLDKMTEVNFEVVPKSFESKKEIYAALQKKLNLLNAHASRVNTLRKELIKTEMRIKHKNNFFERLSKAGDHIFPERKELIKEVSDHFEKDVNAFVETYFGETKEFVPTYFLRDDIKHLQNIAKILTLNSQAFSATRKKLSECWDALKKMDKERKKEIQVKRDHAKKSIEEVLAKIEGVKLSLAESQITPTECLDLIEPIFKDLRSSDLGRDESRELKEKLMLLKKNAQDKLKEKHDERERLEREKRYKKQEAFLEIQKKVQELMQSSAITVEELKTESENIREEAREFLNQQGKEAQDLGKKLKALSDFIEEKEEEALILYSTDSDVDGLKALRDILQQKKKRRVEIKAEIEKLRKSSATSGFDIEKALRLNEQLIAEKERLEKADLAIAEIEEKIVQVREKLRKN